MKYNKGRLNDFNVYHRQPGGPAARAAGLPSAAGRARGGTVLASLDSSSHMQQKKMDRLNEFLKVTS